MLISIQASYSTANKYEGSKEDFHIIAHKWVIQKEQWQKPV